MSFQQLSPNNLCKPWAHGLNPALELRAWPEASWTRGVVTASRMLPWIQHLRDPVCPFCCTSSVPGTTPLMVKHPQVPSPRIQGILSHQPNLYNWVPAPMLQLGPHGVALSHHLGVEIFWVRLRMIRFCLRGSSECAGERTGDGEQETGAADTLPLGAANHKGQ